MVRISRATDFGFEKSVLPTLHARHHLPKAEGGGTGILDTLPTMPPERPEPWTAPDPLPLPIETPRFVIRPYTHDDAPALFDAVESSRDRLLPWLPWAATDNRSLAECHYTIEKFARDMATPTCAMYVLGVFERDTGRLVGGTGLHSIRPDRLDAEFGYWTRLDRHRTGVCTEATRYLISSALTPQPRGWGFRRLVVFANASNPASAGVPRTIGLRQEVDAKAQRWLDTVGWDGWLGWGVLAEEWDCEQHTLTA